MAVEYKCCGAEFFIHVAGIVLLVAFAGMMSGLTLGLMSLSLVDLEVLAKSGTPKDRRHALKILPVVKNQHLLLCTLLLCNAAAMEALPILLDGLIAAWGAILISVTLILLFGEIIPQSVCSRHGLAIGAAVAPVVRVLVWICFPVAYPISKLLDLLLGHGHRALFRRAELKTLVNLHGNEAGKGGELTHDETTIIAGALELSDKTAGDAMTPISETFAIDINAKLDRFLMNLILGKGNSRIPVYFEEPTNIIGLVLCLLFLRLWSCLPRLHIMKSVHIVALLALAVHGFKLLKLKTALGITPAIFALIVSTSLNPPAYVKNLLTVRPEDEIPVKSVTIRRIPRVPETMPLYDILNEFQKGHSHMAVVIRHYTEGMALPASAGASENSIKDVRIDVHGEKPYPEKGSKTKIPIKKWKTSPNTTNNPVKVSQRSKKWTENMYSDILEIDGSPLPKIPEEEEAVGIITMEDVIEELLQEEIFDETDHHVEEL